MKPLAPDPDRIRQERQLLQFLCLPTASGALRTRILRHLSAYPWQDPDHQVLFEALSELSAVPSHEFRTLLPAQLTRKGFPDISLDAYFQPHGLSPDEAEDLARSLTHTPPASRASRPKPAR
jgi:hypothetical protein